MAIRLLEKVLYLCLTGILCLNLYAGQNPQVEHDKLIYDVQVNVQVVPIFAVDQNGDPVYDLKEKDIELYINKKPYKIQGFMSYQVVQEDKAEAIKTDEKEEDQTSTGGKEASETAGAGEERPVLNVSAPERVNFIILDGITNDRGGMRNAKKLARGIINAGEPGDSFILLQASPLVGLQYVIGPEKDKGKLLKALDNIYQNNEWILLVPFNAVKRTAGNEAVDMALLRSLAVMKQSEKNDLKDEYRREVNQFASGLRDLKYILKTIRIPKNIFLISGGIQKFGGDSDYHDQSGKNLNAYYDAMKQAAADVNKGGGLLYLVNPIPETYKINNALAYQSQISSTKFLYGMSTGEVLSRLKKNTSAYYELAFAVTPDMAENFKIKVKCKRKGVFLNTLEYGEKVKPYAQMPEVEKKLFALNVINRGSWSRIVGKVRSAEYQLLGEVRQDQKNIKKINVILPPEFKEKKLDVFVLNVDPETLKADILIHRQEGGDTGSLDLEIEAAKGKEHYIVVVEPEKTCCIYTQVS